MKTYIKLITGENIKCDSETVSIDDRLICVLKGIMDGLVVENLIIPIKNLQYMYDKEY